MADVVKKAGDRFVEVLKAFGANYMNATVQVAFLPVVKNGILELLQSAESVMSGEVEEDKLGDSKGAEQPDLFHIELESCSVIHTGWNYSFTAYTLYCVRVGTDAKGKFFSLARKYQVGYSTLNKMHANMKKEDEKTPALPPDCKHGTYCCCLTYKNDMNATENTFRNYLKELTDKYPNSKALPDTYYLGDKWKAQQVGKKVFDTAFKQTRSMVVKGEYYREIDPFDEGEALTQLLRSVARNEFVNDVRSQLAGKIPVAIPFLINNAHSTADKMVLSAIDTAMAGWPAIQKGVDVAKEEIIKMMQDGGQKLVDEMKPVLAKVLEIVKSKLESKEEKSEEKESKKKTEIGDFVKNWRFERTDIGKTFFGDLGQQDAKAAIDKLGNNINGAINDAIERRLQEGMGKLMGEKAKMEIIQLVIEHVAEQATKLVKKFTSINPLIAVSKSFFDIRAEVENNLIAAQANGADALNTAIDNASAAFWKPLPRIGIRLYKDMEALKTNIKSEMSKLSAEAVTPFTDVCDKMYQMQMKAINSVRTQLILRLKAKLNIIAASKEALTEEFRTGFKEYIFANIQILTEAAWISVAEAINESALVQVTEKFDEKVWPTILSGLEEIQKLIPEPVSKVVKIVPLARAVVDVFLEKATKWVITKLVIKLEEILFNQAERV